MSIFKKQIKTKEVQEAIIDSIKNGIPEGFELVVEHDIPAYIIPLKVYPSGYLNNRDIPLPFLSVFTHNDGVTLYHMALDANSAVLKWFVKEYHRLEKKRLRLGRFCIHFDDLEQVPYELIAELATKFTTDEWIRIYEKMNR